jgi:hypothetical protein
MFWWLKLILLLLQKKLKVTKEKMLSACEITPHELSDGKDGLVHPEMLIDACELLIKLPQLYPKWELPITRLESNTTRSGSGRLVQI